ncbi:hypothetical protein [Spirosoma pulveris]
MDERTIKDNERSLNLYTLIMLGCKLAFGTCILSAETRPRGADNNAQSDFYTDGRS